MQNWHIQLGLAVDQIHGTYHTVQKIDKLNQKCKIARRILANPSQYERFQIRWAKRFLNSYQPIEI